MEIISIKTRIIQPPKDNIFDVIDEYCPTLQEKDILLVTSKVIAIHQGLCIKKDLVENKDDLIKKEADAFIPRKECPNGYAILTIKNNTLIPSAGIDESNANGYYVLWPKNPEWEAKRICTYLKQKFSLKKLAVIITDSHSTPMRYGVMGISIGFYGLEPLNDYRGKEDIFGNILKISQSNVVDALAAMGVLCMGEGGEQTPIVIIRGQKGIEFTMQDTYQDLLVPIKEDIYYPLLKNFYKKKQ
ncbi:MAG: coenzyme F420-0:L-glutamate ligase [bacterium]